MSADLHLSPDDVARVHDRLRRPSREGSACELGERDPGLRVVELDRVGEEAITKLLKEDEVESHIRLERGKVP